MDPAGTLTSGFARAAGRYAERVAVTDGERDLTYAELDEMSDRLAGRLRHAGAAPGQLVGLCAHRSAGAVTGLLAILKSGAAYLPLDPRYPKARIAGALDDARCPILLGHPDLCSALPSPGRTFVSLDDTRADGPGAPERPAIGPGHPAYVIYTSGSTGRPKGVVVTHANAVRLFTATRERFAFTPRDAWTLFHSLAFDFSVWELWGALLHGGRLVVVPFAASRDPAAFLDLLREQRVTVLSQTPAAFRELAAAAGDAGYPGLSLRLVVLGGESLTPATLRGWADGYGTDRPALVNMYGITETTVHVTIRVIEEADLAGTAIPIGAPMRDLRVHILDESLRELPRGAAGEMFVGGAGVSAGYLGRPGLTAERFVPDPFGPPGARLYRSGDLAVRRADGDLEFRGRADRQVQLHGYRVEPGEIEHALRELPGVRAAACVLREDEPGRPRLVAYLVPDPECAQESADHGAVRRALAGRLPWHMIPGAFVNLDRLPLTVNGKLDSGRLPAPAGPPPSAPAGAPTPQGTEAERRLARVWTDVLAVGGIGVHDNFFALGGDSIVAIRVCAAARAAGLDVSVEQLFLNPTIAQLARAAGKPERHGGTAEAALGTLPGPDPPALTPDGTGADIADVYPAAAMQAGILFECELAGDPGLYHDFKSVRVAAPFDRTALERALAALCARHEILRTAFDLKRYREPMQVVRREARIPLEVTNARSADGTAELRAWWRREAADPFDPARAPLVRCHVLPHGEEFRLSLSIHHSVLDGWSLALLMTELLGEYDARLDGDTRLDGGPAAALPPVPPSGYRAFVAAERAALADPVTRRFWERRIACLTDIPSLSQNQGRRQAPGGTFRAVLDEPLVAELHDIARGLGIPAKSVYLAAHLHALRTLAGHPDVVTGLQVSGRLDHQGADRVLGLFVNLVPVRLTVPRGPWQDIALAAFDAERDIQPHRRYPLSALQDAAGRERPVFEAAFSYTDFHVFGELGRLRHVRVLGWQAADRHSIPLLVEISRTPGAGTRVLEVTTGFGGDGLRPAAARLGALVLDALNRMARGRGLGMDLSIMFFGADEGADGQHAAKYGDILSIARAADALGFTAIWTPERHFQEFGQVFPSPAVLGAAIAVATERIAIRAGSVVLPLHHPLRVVEDWAVVDNLSGGRAGLSVATGWHSADFVLAPQAYAGRREHALAAVPLLRSLWAGEPVTLPDGTGQPTRVRPRPRPVSAELPIWITASGRPATWVEAGRLRANVLSATAGQTRDELAEKIRSYRAAYDAAPGQRGTPARGTVTLMAHTFVGTDDADALRHVTAPLRAYLRSYVAQTASNREAAGQATALAAADTDLLTEFALRRYLAWGSLLGSPRTCADSIADLCDLGCDEVACFIDFGLDAAEVLASLRRLADVREGLPA